MTARPEDFPFRWSCRRSGNCCAVPGGFVRVDAQERTALADHLGMTEEAFAGRYLQADGARLKEGLGNRCVFLQDGERAACGVYEARPQKCRDWPFWPEALQDPALMARMLRTCPGIEPT